MNVEGNIISGGEKLDYIGGFKRYLQLEGKSINTIKTYSYSIKDYIRWYEETYGMTFEKLLRPNIIEYKSYLQTVKKYKGRNLNYKTINSSLSALIGFNEYLKSSESQNEIVVFKSDLLKIQKGFNNPSRFSKKDVDEFKQVVLLGGDIQLFALISLLEYTGLRISEALNLRINQLDLKNKELLVVGKGSKQRIVYLNDKVVATLKEYLENTAVESDFMFASSKGERINRSTINKKFNKYGKGITPHQIRHVFCSNMLNNGFSVSEIAYLAGHADTRTTLLYLSPTISEMKRKIELI